MATDSIEATALHAAVEAWVIVASDGEDAADERLPLSAIQGSFMVNSIPWAQMVIPSGKSISDESNEKVLRARELAEKLKQFKTIEAWGRITGDFAPNTPWPTGQFRLFSGYITGTSTVRASGTISVVVHATHWLLDLDASSALSDDVVCGAPVAIQLPAVTAQHGSHKNTPCDELLEKIGEDFWKLALKKKFKSICQTGSILTTLECGPTELTQERTGVGTANNRALRRLEDGDEGVFDADSVIDVPRLSMVEELDLPLRGAIEQGILGRLYNGSLGTSTLWDKLLEIAAVFQFAVVPTIDSAVCAPLSPCMKGGDPPRHLTIKASEYHSFKPSEAMFRMWRGVSIAGHYTSDFKSLDPEIVPEYSFLTSSGCYLADADEDLEEDVKTRAGNGTMQFIEAPDWVMDRSIEAALRMLLTTQDLNNTQDDVEEGSKEDKPEEESEKKEPVRNGAKVKTLGDAYAKWWYWMHQFLPRTGELNGKLRFDVAPGTIVRIEDLDGKLYQDDAASEGVGHLHAMVTSVRFRIDAVNAHASTSMTLSHIRRDSEKQYGTDRHPLYKDRWVGTVLQALEISGGTFVPRPGSHEVA